jgi:two-component system, cell cycle sensor histidine kinase and response regulator CckA
MTDRPAATESTQELRLLAEEKYRSTESSTPVTFSPEESAQLLHELRVHQIELEMQNTELRRIQHDLETSKACYFNLYELAPLGYLTVNDRGVIQKANLAAASIFDIAREDLLNKPITKLIFREDQTVFYLQRNKISDENEVQAWDMRLVRADGSSFWAHLQATPVHNGEYLVTFRDISERKKGEYAIIQAKKNWERTFDAVPDLISIIDTNHTITRVNKAMAERCGHTPEEMIGLKCHEVMHGTSDPPALCPHVKMMQDGLTHSKESDEKRLNGSFDITVSPLHNAEGQITACVHVARDITVRKRLEEERQLLEQQFQQTQKLESLGVLAGGIAHDFNNILAIIMGYCSLTKMDYEDAEKHIPEIEKAAERAAALCKQMLAYAGKASLTQTQVNTWMLVDEMVTMLKTTIQQNVVIKPELGTDIPFIMADASQLRQVVMNLIINAAEAIGDAEGEIEVKLAKAEFKAEQPEKDHLGSTIPAGRYICFEVTDNGCGMDDETRRKIFEPFYTTKFAGRGLGMSAVLGIIKAHNGALQLESRLGHGTTFKVYLPVQISISETEEAQQKAASEPWHGSGMILLAEDEAQVKSIAMAMLQKLGFNVLDAADGKEALELYQQNAADITLVVTDMGMPVMNGYELFNKLKQLDPKLPIIISSGFGEGDIGSKIPVESIAGMINKPYSFEHLREVLKGVVEGCQKQACEIKSGL